MAIILACGWEAGHQDVWNPTYTSSDTVAQGAAAHTGNYGLRVGTDPGPANTFLIPLPVTPSMVYLAVWVRFAGLSSWFGVQLGDGNTITFRRDSATGFVNLYINAGKVADGGLVVAINTWFHFQAYIFVDDAGQVMTRINGYNDINYSGDTKPGASSAITYFHVYATFNFPTTPRYIYLDDLVFDGADWPGDVRVQGIVPNAPGDSAQWSPFPGGGEANWEDVDEVPPDDDTTYVYVGTNAQDDLYNLVNWVAAGNVPLAVVQYARAKKMSVDATAFRLLAKEGGITVVSGNQTLTTAYKYFQGVLLEKPSTGGWTEVAIGNLQAGQRSVI